MLEPEARAAVPLVTKAMKSEDNQQESTVPLKAALASKLAINQVFRKTCFQALTLKTFRRVEILQICPVRLWSLEDRTAPTRNSRTFLRPLQDQNILTLG